jgi:CO dehydrogenase maturation factor
MKIAISGKGGSGKTTLSALLVQKVAEEGRWVLAVDADPDPNLASALGFEDADGIVPLAKMKDLMEERLGHKVEGAAFFKLNPKVDDIPERFSRTRDNIKLITMGHVEEGGRGCMCVESSFLKNVMDHILLNEGDWVVMDMEAGVEHLGRATAKFVDALLVAVEPSPKALKTAERVRGLAADIGLGRIGVVATKVRGGEDLEYIRGLLDGLPLVGAIPFSEGILEAERRGSGRIGLGDIPEENIKEIIEGIEALKKN